MHLSGTTHVGGRRHGAGVALLMQAHPNMSAAQLKIALQTGSTYMRTAVSGRRCRKRELLGEPQDGIERLLNLLSTVVGGGEPGGRHGVLGLGQHDGGPVCRVGPARPVASKRRSQAHRGLLQWGDLNVLGLSNPGVHSSPRVMWVMCRSGRPTRTDVGDQGSTRRAGALWGDLGRLKVKSSCGGIRCR